MYKRNNDKAHPLVWATSDVLEEMSWQMFLAMTKSEWNKYCDEGFVPWHAYLEHARRFNVI